MFTHLLPTVCQCLHICFAVRHSYVSNFCTFNYHIDALDVMKVFQLIIALANSCLGTYILEEVSSVRSGERSLTPPPSLVTGK